MNHISIVHSKLKAFNLRSFSVVYHVTIILLNITAILLQFGQVSLHFTGPNKGAINAINCLQIGAQLISLSLFDCSILSLLYIA